MWQVVKMLTAPARHYEGRSIYFGPLLGGIVMIPRDIINPNLVHNNARELIKVYLARAISIQIAVQGVTY